MVEERAYPVSREYLLNIISDIIELQHGKETGSDTTKGVIRFSTAMYRSWYSYSFTIYAAGGEYRVRLETDGEKDSDRQRVLQMFALFESLMSPPKPRDEEKP